MRGRGSFLFFSMLMLGGFFLWALAPLAAAAITGPCTGTMNGVDANSIATPGTALEVPYDGSVSVVYVSSGNITGHKAGLEFAGFYQQIEEKADDGNSWSSTLSVADYAKYGVGIYKVKSETYGDVSCTGTAYVKVTGKNPVTTTAGAAGAAAAGIGVIGMGGGAVASSRKPGILDGIMDDIENVGKRKPDPEALTVEEMTRSLQTTAMCLGCVTTIPVALLQTVAFMVVGAGGIGAPAPVIRWRPYISVISVIGSLLAALGSLVLAQQYAVFYPSRTVSVIWLVIWLALGIAIPSLTRLIGIRKANSIIAQKVAALYAGAETRAGEAAADQDQPEQ